MPKTQVLGEAYGLSFTFKHALWPGMEASNLYLLGGVIFGVIGLRGVNIAGVVDGLHPGQYGFQPTFSAFIPPDYDDIQWFDIPAEGYEYAEIEVLITPTGARLRSETEQNIIGNKANPTHSKEIAFDDVWFVPAGSDFEITFGDVTKSFTTDTDIDFAPIALLSGLVDADDWSDHMVGVKYAMSIEDIRFSGNPIDTSEYKQTTWGGTAASVDKLWVEGFGGNSIGFWCSDPFYNGDYVFNNYEGGFIRAPFSYDFSQYQFKWMDDTPLPDALEVYCTGIRTLNSSGIDIGPWHGTIAELKALGRYTQKTGCYYWNTDDPDMQASVALYLSLTSAEAHGIEIRGPRPEYKVEGAGWGQTINTETEEVIPGPVDGQYHFHSYYNGEKRYTNGQYHLYCTDPEGPDWAIGPGPPEAPFYTQDAGGPAGAYLVNTAVYEDTIIDEETGQRQFSGFAGEGIGPAVSADTGEAINVDSDCAEPSFRHDATCCFDAWPLSATSRTASPYMTDVVSLTPVGTVGVYADAHTHEDWVGDNATTPTADGEFVVSAGGGTITLTLASNYIARQGKVGGVDEVPVPTAYRCRRHDSLLGEGATPEEAEARYDWRGFYLAQDFKFPSLPQTVTCTITYYDDLLGCSDNHKTDSTRQTEYAYDPGELLTLTREIEVSYESGGWSTVTVDLLNELEQAHPLALVTSLQWTLPAGAYTMNEPQLLERDAGDRQELLPGSPGYREDPGGASMRVKVDESWQYAQGVVSAHYDGYHDRVLFVPDNAKACTVERCMDTLNVLIGAKTGVDLTSNYLLSGWPVQNSSERWVYTHSAAAEEAHLVDEDDAALVALRCYDLMPQMAGSSGALPVAVRCAEVTAVAGLPYTFYGRKYCGGRAQGFLLKADLPSNFPRARSTGNLALYRRPLDPDDPTAPWQYHTPAGSSDAHGRWQSAVGTVWGPDTETRVRLWEYAIQERTTSKATLGRFATREWANANTTYYDPFRGDPFLCRDVAGTVTWLILAADDLNCRLYYIDAGSSLGLVAATTHPLQGGKYKQPSVAVLADGAIIAAATDTNDDQMVFSRSRDGAATWEAPVAGLGTNLQSGRICYAEGLLYASGWYDDKVWLAATSRADLQREVLDGLGDLIPVCDAAGEAVQSAVAVREDGAIVVAVEAAGGVDLYVCENLIEGFAQVT